jgi:hypothetical protein
MWGFRKACSVVWIILIVIAATAVHADLWAEDTKPDITEAEVKKPDTTEVDWWKLWENIPQAFGLPDWFPRLIGAQFNGTFQWTPAFHDPYEGPKSFTWRNGLGHDITHTYGAYFGSQITPYLQFYLDFELFQGYGISDGIGLGGYVNGDVIRAGSSNLPKIPYVARSYFRYYYPLSGEMEKVERQQDQLPGQQPVSRLEVKAGWFALSDDFDNNRYANNNRTQFFNYDFIYNTAWDYASNTRGYTAIFETALYQPRWRVLFGAGWEPNTANGANFNTNDDSFQEIGYNFEFDYKLNDSGTIVRFLSYCNTARMGNYEEALELATRTKTVPSLLEVERLGGTKYGFGLNFEQPLADDGNTGIFGRLGWNDGHYETWEYTECDRTVSLGAQLSGCHWNRKEDVLGIAYGVNGLSKEHEDYLAAGGVGILLGDGKLNYGFEQVFETYYRIQLCSFHNLIFQLSPDFQIIRNPAYNMDRGPCEVYGIRLHIYY